MTVHRTVLFVLSMTFFLMSASGVMYAGIGGGSVIACTPIMADSGLHLGDVVVVDDSSVVVCGSTKSAIKAGQGTRVKGQYQGATDGFVAKLSRDHRRIEWLVYVGGSGSDSLFSISLMSDGSIAVAGMTTSSDIVMPSTTAFRTRRGQVDGVIAIVDANNQAIVAVTYLGGSKDDVLRSIAVDKDDNVVVCGSTTSNDLPVREAFDVSFNGMMDGMVAKLSRTLSQLIFMTYLGGGSTDNLTSVALASEGDVLVTGWTDSDDYSIYIRKHLEWHEFVNADSSYDVSYNGGRDAIITVLSSNGNALVLSSFYGGSQRDEGLVAKYDAKGRPTILGVTTSKDLPMIGAFQDRNAGRIDGFVASLSTDGEELMWATYVGASGDDILTDFEPGASSQCLIVGTTNSNNWQTTRAPETIRVDGVSDVIVLQLDGHGLSDVTLMGGSGEEKAPSLSIIDKNQFYVACGSTSRDVFAGDTAVHLAGSQSSNAGAVFAFSTGNIDLVSIGNSTELCRGARVAVSWSAYDVQSTTTFSLEFESSTGNWVELANGLTTRSYSWVVSDVGAMTRLRLRSSYGHIVTSSSFHVADTTEIIQQPTSVAACSGDEVVLVVRSHGENLEYQWLLNGMIIAGANDSTYSIKSVDQSSAGEYYVVVNGSCGYARSTDAHVRVVSATEIVRQPQDVVLKLGDRLELTCEANVDDVTVQWFHNEVLLSTATSATYVVESVSKADEGIYRCLVTGSCGTASTRDVTVSIDATTSAVDDQNNASFRVSIMNGVIHVEHAPGRIDRIDCVDVTGRQLRADDLRVFRGPAFVLVTLADGRQHRRTVVLP
ncbi:MAG TPA: immunoglobulin domain-containing protein [Chlorobiota bacterium]|nr:immunoglobulin domain-containing protein [Chlorobiota bacterium]